MRKEFSLISVQRNHDFIEQVQRQLKLPADGLAGRALYSLMSTILGIQLVYPTDEQLKSRQ